MKLIELKHKFKDGSHPFVYINSLASANCYNLQLMLPQLKLYSISTKDLIYSSLPLR